MTWQDLGFYAQKPRLYWGFPNKGTCNSFNVDCMLQALLQCTWSRAFLHRYYLNTEPLALEQVARSTEAVDCIVHLSIIVTNTVDVRLQSQQCFVLWYAITKPAFFIWNLSISLNLTQQDFLSAVRTGQYYFYHGNHRERKHRRCRELTSRWRCHTCAGTPTVTLFAVATVCNCCQITTIHRERYPG